MNLRAYENNSSKKMIAFPALQILKCSQPIKRTGINECYHAATQISVFNIFINLLTMQKAFSKI